MPNQKQKLSIIIPVFNEVATCGLLLDLVLNKQVPGLDKEIIIVESNSTDGSRQVVQKYAVHPEVKLVLQDRPLGKGFAVRAGFNECTGDIILIQDADLEYDINDYDKVVAPILRGETDFVLGSRHLGAQTWQIRVFEAYPGTTLLMNAAHHFFTFMFNMLYGQKTTDPATMFKVFRRTCLNGIQFRCNRFDFDFELAGQLVLNGYSPLEVAVSYNSRGFEQGKKVRFFRDPITWVRVLIMTRLRHKKRAAVLLSSYVKEK